MGIMRFARRLAAGVVCLSLLTACGSNGLTGTTRRSPSLAAQPVRRVCVNGGGCRVPVRDRSRYLDIAAIGAGPVLPYVLAAATSTAATQSYDVTFRFNAGGRAYELVGYNSRGACDSLLRSPNGRYLIYGIARNGWPALELLDLRTGARTLFHAHACHPAWGHDNQIAYVHYLVNYSATGGYKGRIVVQQGLGRASSVWTGRGAWTELIWTGTDLLANDDVARPDGVNPGPLVIVYSPGEQHAVDAQPGHQGSFSTVVALNPQGTEALLDTERLGPGGGGPGAEDFATLVRISDAAVLSTARMNRDEAHTSDLAALAPDGSWQGNEVIATDGVFLGGSSHPPASLATLTVNGNRIRVRSIKQFIEHGQLPTGTGPRPGEPSTFSRHQRAADRSLVRSDRATRIRRVRHGGRQVHQQP